MMTTFTENSPWQEWVDYAHEKGPVDPDPSSCSISVWCRSLGGITIADAVSALAPAGEDQIRTAIWIVMHAFAEFPSTFRLSLLHVICADPPRAAYVYREMASDHLSDEEKRLLWNAFASSMPVMREKLAREIGEPIDG